MEPPFRRLLARERFLLIGENGLSDDYLEHFANVLEDILQAYDGRLRV